MFGINPWGVALRSSLAWFTIIYGCLAVAAIFGLVEAWRRHPASLLSPFSVAILVWLLVVFLTTVVGVGGNDRELQFGVGVLTFALGLSVLYATNVRAMAAVVGLAGGALVLVRGASAAALLHDRVFPDRPEFATVDMIEALHLHKGYAEYWDAGIDRFLSRDSLDIINVECRGGSAPYYFNWWSDKGMLTCVQAKRTFYILSETDTSVCSLGTPERLLGNPARTVQVPTLVDPTEVLYL